jgi:hypothetical protein
MHALPRISARKRSHALLGLSLISLWGTAAITPAAAYRPFDGTNAAVADPGKMEVELQPAGRLRDESGTALIAPATRFNFGLRQGWEAVVETKSGFVGLIWQVNEDFPLTSAYAMHLPMQGRSTS